jgi:hypothetical protein
MARKDDPYAGRIHPCAKPHDRFPSPHRAANRAADHEEMQKNQFRENAHGLGYSNDVRKTSWLQSGRAVDKPSFDHWQDRPSMKRNKGNSWGK